MKRLVSWDSNLHASPIDIDLEDLSRLDSSTRSKLETIFIQLCVLTDMIGEDIDLSTLNSLITSYRSHEIVLPLCKVGDTVYVITHKDGSALSGREIVTCKVTTMRIKSDGITIGYSCRGFYSNGNRYNGNFVFKSIGRTVFFNKTEAEKHMESN